MPVLDREEYIEQAYFFKTFLERLAEDLPSQEILISIKEEILATTRLPLALDVLRGEMLLKGRLCEGMAHLPHYFAPFQTFVMRQSEEDRTKFDQRVALLILEREARYRGENGKPAGLFVYQFECLSRNRLGDDTGMAAIANDPVYDANWRDWILRARMQLGTVEFADMIYFRSEFYVEERRKLGQLDEPASVPMLFGRQEGRIAKANRGKDPLYLFAALQRQLGYPAVPRPRTGKDLKLPPHLELRLQRVEKRIHLLEAETKGELDLSEFYAHPRPFEDPPHDPLT